MERIALFKICGVSRYHHPLNLLNPLNPHTEGMPKGEAATTTSELSEPGPQSGPYSRPFRLAALATHPRKGGGQVKRRRGTYSLKLAASAATTTLGLKGRQTYEPSGRQVGQS